MADDPVLDTRQMMVVLATIEPRVHRALGAAFAFHEPRAVAYARQNAPWRDRTTNARNGLFAKASPVGRRGYQMVIGHGVPYGIWLEVRFSGRYAIIRPTIDHVGPELMVTATSFVYRELGGRR